MYNKNMAYDFSIFEEEKVHKRKKILRFPHKRQKRLVEFRIKLALILSI
jgi:hypothetical protein